MPSEKDIRYRDVISGQENSSLSQLPKSKPGYDTYVAITPKPKNLIAPKDRGLARYIEALPLDNAPLTLGEGSTPLIPSKTFDNVFIKHEGLNPSGNFKDRESAVAMAYAKKHNLKKLAIASSGNAALSAALYAKIYGIELTCYVPKRTSEYKKNLIKLFGGHVNIAGETYEDSYYELLRNKPEDVTNITPGVFPLRSEGTKTISYEIWEELGKAPDVIVCPAGNGSALASIYHGFYELKEWGFIEKVPAMVCVQVKGADPINQALLRNEWMTVLDKIPESDCEAIVAKESFCSPKAVGAIKDSGGFGISIDDQHISEGLRFAIDKEGILPELSSASVFSAMLSDSDKIHEAGETIVLINSATGLKEIELLQSTLSR